LAAIMIIGWGLVWQFANKPPEPTEKPAVATASPEPIVPDRSIEFETVTDRTPVGFRDNAAYELLLRRARDKTPNELAAIARRDIALAQLWQSPEMYRGIPIHLLGSAQRVLRYQSKLSKTGWIYEASIIPPDNSRVPYVCVFEDAPPGFPIGTNVSERVVFNGYFFKIWIYHAADVPRGAPLLVGKIGWEPREASPLRGGNSTLNWSLTVLAVLFVISLLRWIYQLWRSIASPRTRAMAVAAPSEQIDPVALDAWARSLAPAPESTDDEDDTDES
jgi:hypothetical protein